MRRRPSRVLVALAVAVALAAGGCSANSVKREDPTGSTTPSTTRATTTPTKPATTKPATTKPATTKPTASTPAPAPAATIAIPKVASAEQPAVDDYISFLRAAYVVGQDPGEVRRGDMTMYLGSKALKAENALFDAMAAAGTAFRGNPDNPRVTVDFIASEKEIVLNSCPLPDKTDPYHVIKVSTGKTVAPPKQNPPPPFELRLIMFHNKKGKWVLIDSIPDTSHTCTG